MGIRPTKFCDICHGEKDVDTFILSVNGKAGREIDLCSKCQRSTTVGMVLDKSRRSPKSTIRKQHRFEVTTIDKSML